MKKNGWFLFFAVLSYVCMASFAFAAVDGKATTDSVYEEYGNKRRLISVTQSTTSVVLISSAATASGLGINSWREREIINFSSSAAMAIYYDNTTYTVYKSSFGVILSSATSGIGIKTSGGANVHLTHYQGPIWAIWDTNGSNGGAGAGGHEDYQK